MFTDTAIHLGMCQ